MRTCTKCKKELSIDKFNERAPGYLYRQCQKCRTAAAKLRFKDHPESKLKAQKRSKEWYLANKDRIKEINSKNKKYRASRDRWYRIKNTYSISEETYSKILESQNNSCAICKSKNKKFYIDHDHKCCPTEISCGRCIRGIICQKCNMFMHYVDEYLEYLDIAVIYSKNRINNPEIPIT